MTGRLLRLPDVIRETGLKRSTIYRRIDAGTFPSQHAYDDSPTSPVFWYESEIEAWKAARAGVIRRGTGPNRKAEAAAATAA